MQTDIPSYKDHGKQEYIRVQSLLIKKNLTSNYISP